MNMRNDRQLMMALCVLWAALAAQAQTTYKWRADIGSGNWSDESKWDPTGVPGLSNTANFREPQTEPFTVSFTSDASAKLLFGSQTPSKPVVVTFDLNGHTLTHTNGALEVYYATDWTILNGTLWSHPTAGILNVGYFQGNWVPKVTVGSGATYLYNGNSYIQVASRSDGEMVVKDGGVLITQPSARTDAIRLGHTTGTGYTNYTARLTVAGEGSVWSNLAGSVLLANYPLATAELVVTNGGRVVNNGGSLRIASTTNVTASMLIASGGVVDARSATDYLSVGHSSTGTVTVTGTGSVLLPSENYACYLGYTADAGNGTLIIEDGGLVEKKGGSFGLVLGNADNAFGKVVVRNGGMLRWAGGQGTVAVGGYGSSAGSVGEFEVTGVGSRVILGEFPIGPTRGNATVTVSDGGTLECFRTAYIGRINTNSVSSHNGLAKLIVTGTGSVLKKSALTAVDLPGASVSTTMSLGVGGCGFAGWTEAGLLYYITGGVPGVYGPGGRGEAVIENGGLVDLNGYIGVYSNSLLRIDGGRMQSARIGLETNAVLNAVLRAGDANGTALMTASTEVRLWGPTLSVERGEDFVAVPGDVYTLISGPLHASINRFTYDGAVLQDGDLIKAGGATFKVGYTSNAVTLTVRQTGTMIRVL